MGNDKLELKVSDEKHIKSDESDINYDVKKDTSTSVRTDENNIDIDNEMTNLAANQLMYNFLIDRAKGKLSTKLFIINDGRK